MKELLEQYKRIQAMKESLSHVRSDIPGLVSDEAIQLINDQLNVRLDSLAHQIVRLIQNGPPDEPQPICKPLWAVIAAGEPDSKARARGMFGGAKYQLFFTKEDAIKHAGNLDEFKVVQVWGE